MTNRAVLTERRESVLLVTINRPEARNSVNAAVAEGIGDAIELARRDPDIRVVVLTGSGDTAFCSGGDLKDMAAGQALVPADPEKRAWGFGGICEHPIDKPVIAAVNGAAIGGGFEIAMACDLIVADDTAYFSLPEVRNGFLASAGGAVWLAQWVPRVVAMEILLLGDRFTAAQAKEWGLVNRVVPRGDALAVALEMAEVLAANAPLAVQASKRLVAGLVGTESVTDREAWARSNAEKKTIEDTEDAKEGPRAFTEKRPAIWKGR
nr:enoyl-CoA hydratase-related protein [Rhodococcus opacus]